MITNSSVVTITNFTFGATFDENIDASNKSVVFAINCNFSGPTSGFGGAVGSYLGSLVRVYGTIGYSGSGYSFLETGEGGIILFGYSDNVTSNPVNLTITGTPTFSTGFAAAASNGNINFYANVITFSGSANGPRYSATSNSVINTSGSGASYLPGSSTGATSSGGQYI